MIDAVKQKIKEKLEAYEALQTGEASFSIKADQFRFAPKTKGAYVYLYFGNLIPTSGSSTRGTYQVKCTYFLDCVVIGRGIKSGSDYIEADEQAATRLTDLIEQIFEALYGYQGLNLGFSTGQIGSRNLFRVDAFTDQQEQTENVLIGARITLDIEFGMKASKADGPALEVIGVTGLANGEAVDVVPDERYST